MNANLQPLQFHATYQQGWSPAALPPDTVVHVGNRAAAESRARGSHHLYRHLGTPQIHEVEIAGKVHPKTFSDTEAQTALGQHPEYDAVRYQNDHEDIGSTSYAVRARALRVRRSEPLQGIHHTTIEME